MIKTNFLFSVIFVTLFAKIFAFFRDIVLAYYYGVSSITDIYIISTTIPVILFTFIASAINANFIPIFHKIKNQINEASSIFFTSSILYIFFIVVFIIFLLIFFYPRSLVQLFASGFSESNLDLASQFLQITSFAIFFNLFFNIFKNYLQANNSHYPQILAPIPLNISIMLGVYLSYIFVDYMWLPYSFLIGIVLQFLFLFASVHRFKFSYRPIFSNSQYLVSFFSLSIPIFIQALFIELNTIVDKNIASLLISDGGVSALSFSKQIENLFYSLFIASSLMIYFPLLSESFSTNDTEAHGIFINKSFYSVYIFSIPISFLLFFFSEELVSLIYERGNFDTNAVYLTSTILKYSSFGLIALGFNQTLLRLYYINSNTIYPLFLFVASVFVNILLNLFFLFYSDFGLSGIAISTSVSYFFISFLGYFKYKYLSFISFNHVFFFLKIVSYSLLSVLLSSYLTNHILLFDSLSFTSIFLFTFSYLIFIVSLSFHDLRNLLFR